MPIPNSGVVPGGAVYNELNALTRRAFIPKITVQIYYSSPTLMKLLGNAQRAAGGLSQITAPLQGASVVQGGWTNYSGSFNKPTVIPGTQNGQWNLSYYIVPVPLQLGEALLQSTEAVVPILDVRMNDVRAVTVQQMASSLFTNNSANPYMPSGFVEAYDNGTNVPTYGGISRTTVGNSFWQGQYYNANTQNILNRATLASYIIQITDNAGGECPDFAIMSPSDFAALNASFVGIETIQTFPGQRNINKSLDANVRSSFPNLIVSGVPHYMEHWCPKGTIYYVNSRYTSMYLSEDAAFNFSGFYSTIPLMQVGQVGVMIIGYNVITLKPSSGAVITNFVGGAY